MNEKYRIAEVNNRKLIALRPLPSETLKSLKNYYCTTGFVATIE